MEKPTKRVDNFGTFLKTVSRPRPNAVRVEVSPMAIIETLSHHDDAIGIVELAEESNLPISQTVMAIEPLKAADLIEFSDLNEMVSLTPMGRNLANIPIGKLQSR